MDEIRITMLGVSGAGKTCFMIGMYAAMREGVKGFTFTTDLDVDLDLSNAWDLMVEGQDDSRWPKSTLETTHYSFDFCYGLRKLLGFSWMDYRGGALGDRSTAQDTQELLNYLAQSTCVLLCVPGKLLATSAEKRKSKISKDANIANMLQHLARVNEQTTTPPAIVIVITKYDEVPETRTKEEIIEDVKLLFNPLFTPDTGWLVMICPVTLGADLGSNLQYGQIDPENIHLAVTFSVYYAFKQEAARIAGQKHVDADRLRTLESKNWLQRILSGDERKGIRFELDKHARLISEAESKMGLLTRELMQNTSVYYEGEEVELDT